MTQTPTTDPSAHDSDKNNWDENALGNFDKQGRTNGKITR
jgi:hypothetical protein